MLSITSAPKSVEAIIQTYCYERHLTFRTVTMSINVLARKENAKTLERLLLRATVKECKVLVHVPRNNIIHTFFSYMVTEYLFMRI